MKLKLRKVLYTDYWVINFSSKNTFLSVCSWSCIQCFSNIYCISVCPCPGPVFSYKLRYIIGFSLVEMAISTNPKPTIYRKLYENTGPGLVLYFWSFLLLSKRWDHVNGVFSSINSDITSFSLSHVLYRTIMSLMLDISPLFVLIRVWR